MSQDPYHSSPQPGSVMPKQSNGLGIAGFVVSLLGIPTCGMLSPIGALLSFIAVFKQPRGFAIAGLVIGALGSIFLAMAGVGMIMGLAKLGGAGNVMKSGFAIAEAQQKILAYQKAHEALPDDEEGQELIEDILDGNEMALRYKRLDDDKFELRSAGVDKEFDTPDDLPSVSSTSQFPGVGK